MRMSKALQMVCENVQEMKKDKTGNPMTMKDAEKEAVKKAVSKIKSTGMSYSDWEKTTTFGPKLKQAVKTQVEELDLDEEWIDVEEAVNMLEEGKSSTGYELYHNDFSSAMKHAYDFAKKKYGITIDPEEIDSKVATGPKKPSEGKTNSYSLKGDKGIVQIQVYNKGGSKPYELNMYKS